MNHNFKKTKSITSGILVLLALSSLSISNAMAGEPGDDSASEESGIGTPETIRFEEELDLVDDRADMRFRVFRRAQEPRRIWHIEAAAVDRPDDAICRATIPIEAGEDYYDFQIDHLETETGAHLVLLESKARDNEGPLDPPTYQIALYLVPRTGATRWSCSVIGRGEYSTLDGGARMRMQDIDGQRTLTREQTTEDVTFCGLRAEEEAGLEVFDGEMGRFLRGTPVDVAEEDAVKLEAVLPDETIPPPLTYRFYSWMNASSDVRGAPAGVAVPRPLTLGNLELRSPWIEGVDGLGRGEYVTAGINTAAPLQGLRVFPGHGASEEHFRGYARPTRLLVGLSDGHRFVVDLPEATYEELIHTGGVYVELPEPMMTRCISVMIIDAVEGDLVDAEREDHHRLGRSVAISEITAYSTLDAATDDETARRIVAEVSRDGSMARRDRIAELGDLIPGAMVDAVDVVLRTDDQTQRTRAVSLLARMPSDRSLPVLRSHMQRMDAADEDYRQTKRSIVAHGSASAPTLLELLDSFDREEEPRKYVDTIRLIGRVGSDIHLMRLIVDLGEGDERTRRERIRAIANGGIGVVPRLISKARSSGDDQAGLDALTALVFVGQRHFAHQQAEVDGVDDLSQTYLASESRAHRIRAIEALGYFEHPEGDALLGEEILATDRDPVIRASAASALKLYQGELARTSLETALEDESPDVRLAAVRTLNHRDDGVQASKSVVAYAKVERWPRGMHHATQLLARSPDPKALDALAEIVDRDLTAQTAGTALRALRRSERTLSTADVATHLANPEAPSRVLEQLVQMLAFANGDDDEAFEILTAVANRDYQPLAMRTENELETLSSRALMALGRSTSERAGEFLFSVVEDQERSTRDRSNALRGLGFFSDEQLLSQLQDLAPRIPREIRPRFRDTLRMIQSRLSIEDTEEDIQHLIDRLDEELEQEAEDEFE